MESLGPVIDTDAIARADGTLGVLKVDVIEEWLVDGVTLELVVSRLLTCGRCDGGGCDGCNKSGAIRISGAGVSHAVRFARSSRPNRAAAPTAW
ncbi:MAG TPA: hypothetical protein VM580_26400 [Labilithrix sp.]|nr:hypothetical protein [Labilithrix sp.]